MCLLFLLVQGLEMSDPVCGHLSDSLGKWEARENEAEAVLIENPPRKVNMTRRCVEKPAERPFLHSLCLQSYGYQVDVVVVGR